MSRFTTSVVALLLAASPALAVDTSLLALVGPDAKVVGGISVAQTMNSPFGQFLLSRLDNPESRLRDFIDATNFDPRRDLLEIVFASNADAAQQRAPGVILARGVFNGPQIYAAARAKGAKVVQYSGIDVVQSQSTRGGWLAILDGRIAIAGDETLVKAALDRRNSKPALPSRLSAKVNEFSTRYDAWLVSTAPLSNFAAQAPDRNLSGAMRAGAMEAIEQTSAGLKFGTMVELEGEAITRSEKDAGALVDIVRFLAGMLNLNKDKSADGNRLANLLNTLKVSAEANTMKFSLSVPQSDVEELLRSRGQRRAAKLQ